MPKYFYPKIPFFFEDMEEAGYKLGELLLKRINGEKISKLQIIMYLLGRSVSRSPRLF